MSGSSRPVVIKKVKKDSHGAHGSWKIAYADFMTAMMAFFLVMWLLSGTSKAQLEGINEYFRHPTPRALASGDKMTASDSAIPGGGDDPTHAKGEVRKSQPKSVADARLRDARRQLQTLIKQEPALAALGAQLKIDLTDQGLRIQILDDNQQSMFKLGSSEVVPRLARVLEALAPFLNKAPYGLTVSGHTDDTPYLTGQRGYSNWELSSDRANAARRQLIHAGLASDLLIRVTGHASTMNLTTQSSDAINRRISIVLLSEAARQAVAHENQATQEGGFTSSDKVMAPHAASTDIPMPTPP